MSNQINLEGFQQDLLHWYKSEARELPWRSDPTPYKVWISEMMLQQTRVDTAIPFFGRFIEELPAVSDLARVSEDKLLKLWQGLGYYNRALNLKKAAEIIMKEYGGEIPSDRDTLQSLPGIGPYSSGAIASIAFGGRVPAVDGNVIRIMARITGDLRETTGSVVKKELEALVVSLIPSEDPGDFNQALMDLGATICLPNGEPKCSLCPVKNHCEALERGMVDKIPVKSAKKPRIIDKKTVLILTSPEGIALEKRSGGGLLPNLWEYPNLDGHLSMEEVKQVLLNQGLKPDEIKPLKASKHIFSHREWHMIGYLIQLEVPAGGSAYTWATTEEIHHRYSIPTAFKEYLKSCRG